MVEEVTLGYGFVQVLSGLIIFGCAYVLGRLASSYDLQCDIRHLKKENERLDSYLQDTRKRLVLSLDEREFLLQQLAMSLAAARGFECRDRDGVTNDKESHQTDQNTGSNRQGDEGSPAGDP
jgi:hypothetical protein